MPNFQYSVGLRNVGSYQVSGVPWITGSTSLAAGFEDQIKFPSVAKAITVINRDIQNDDLRVHFNATGSGGVVSGLHYVTLDSKNDSVTFNVKCKEIYISMPYSVSMTGSYTVIAELTGIPADQMFILTGSGLTV